MVVLKEHQQGRIDSSQSFPLPKLQDLEHD